MMCAMTQADRRAVAAWLLACALLVAAMVVLGGVTRLTRSGLSIVEWQPLMGALPPLSEAHWQELFAKYRETPEFRLVNHAMDLQGFKGIFWLEYFHRLLGRAIGVVFLVPFAFFLLKKRLDKPLFLKLSFIFLLGALQGVLGWYMVKSGLVDDPRVSHFRLTAHLGLALAIFAAELWVALNLLFGRKAPGGNLEMLLPLLVFLMALSGGMVAGLRAGYAYNTFPLMNGQVVPPETFLLEPWWMNFLYNMAGVQLVHRALFWTLAALIPLAWWRSRHALTGNALLAVFLLQAALGISTLLLGVPVALAAAHQAGAVLLFAAALCHAHRAAPRQAEPALRPAHAA